MAQGVQVLPYVPTPLEQLTPHLSQFGANIGEGLSKRRAQTALQQLLARDQQKDFSNSINENVEKTQTPQRSFNPIQIGQIEQLMEQGYGKEAANAGIRSLIENQKSQSKEVTSLRKEATAKEEALWNYKPTQDFIKNVEERASDAEIATQAADEFIQLAESGEISPSNLRNLAASKYGETFPFLHSPSTAKAKLLEKIEAKGMKEIFPRPTEREFFFINSAQAQLGKTDAANIAVANLQKKFASLPLKSAEFAQQVIQENGGIPPRDISAQVRKKMSNYKKDLINESAQITFEYGDKKEKQESAEFLHSKGNNVELTPEKARELYDISGKDSAKARKLAAELGYKIRD